MNLGQLRIGARSTTYAALVMMMMKVVAVVMMVMTLMTVYISVNISIILPL